MTQTVKWYMDTDDDDQIRIARTDLADLYLADENPVSALKECELVLQTTNVKNRALRKWQIVGRKGICLAALKEFSNAMAAAEELRQINETESPVSWQRLYPFLMGKIEYAKRNYKKANEYLGSAVKMMEKSPGEGLDISPYEYIYSLAESYYQSGNLEKAKAEFEKIQGLFYDFNRRLDRIGLSSYLLGKIYEQQGNKAQAIENYEKFLGLWKDADPSLPEVADARERVAALKNNQD